MDQRVELDVEPFAPRPDTILPLALDGTGLPIVEASSKIFGCWTFDYTHVSRELWVACHAVLEKNIRKLYSDGRIRYGSWGTVDSGAK